MEEIIDSLHHHYGKDEGNVEISNVYRAVGGGLAVSGKIDEASDLLKQGFQVKQAIYGGSCAHPEIAISLNNSGVEYRDQGKHKEAVKTYKRSIEMNQVIYVEECAHLVIANSLSSLGVVYQYQENWRMEFESESRLLRT